MADLKTFKNYLIVAIFLYVLVMAGLAWLVGDSYILALIGILGWLALVGFVVKYVSLSKRDQRDRS